MNEELNRLLSLNNAISDMKRFCNNNIELQLRSCKDNPVICADFKSLREGLEHNFSRSHDYIREQTMSILQRIKEGSR